LTNGHKKLSALLWFHQKGNPTRKKKPQVKRLEALSGICGRGVLKFYPFACQLLVGPATKKDNKPEDNFNQGELLL